MQISITEIRRYTLLSVPYIVIGLMASNLSFAWRLTSGSNISERIMSFFLELGDTFQTIWPSLHPVDLLFGACCGGLLRLAVYVKGRNAKKFRHNEEYGSARWSA